MKKYSLYELQAYLQRVIALNFQEPVWVTAEISQIKRNRGHIYIDLVDKNEDGQEVRAQSAAVIWSKNLIRLRNSVGDLLDDLLQEGIEVSLQVDITFHAVYGLKLSVLQLDPNYTLGKMELQRQETILRLKKEGLLSLNSQLLAPIVFQKIAIISSEGASGYRDFVEHLRHNEFGYQYDLTLYKSAVQGRLMEEDLVSGLSAIAKSAKYYDVVVIIRGGGSKIDLAGFDLYNIAKAVALCKVPVITGIGHETDATVSDLVAFRSLKTPTAVANFLVDHNAAFEGTLQYILQKIIHLSQRQTSDAREQLKVRNQEVSQLIRSRLKRELVMLSNTKEIVRSLVKRNLSLEKLKIDHLAEKIQMLNPQSILEKGYTLTLLNGAQVKTKSKIAPGDVITTLFHDGSISSKVENVNDR